MSKKKVYIGVGHGGADPGAVGYLREEDVNLAMAKACRDYLEANGVDTKISREIDEEDSVATKVKEANTWGADLALDIHNNAGGGDGAEVYHSIVYGTGKVLSDNILEEMKKIGQNSRGSKTKKGTNGDYFGFIRSTNMPAVITEAVFVDNKADASQADTPEECKAFGEAIAKGVLKTLGITVKTSATTTTKPTTPTKAPVKNDNAGAFLVKVTVDALNVRAGAGTNYSAKSVIRDRGTYTIVETKIVSGIEWGRLKSGAGWIALSYTKRV